MAFGSININTSRRGYCLRCYLYTGDNKQVVKENLNKPNGVFFAKYLRNFNRDLNTISGFWQNQQIDIAIETQDRIKVRPNNYVLIGEDLYIVQSVNREAFTRNTQFMSEPYYITTISLLGA